MFSGIVFGVCMCVIWDDKERRLDKSNPFAVLTVKCIYINLIWNVDSRPICSIFTVINQDGRIPTGNRITPGRSALPSAA